jgi:hypothetical protein
MPVEKAMSAEWAKLLLTLVTAVLTALWTLKKWREQRDKEFQEREKERQQERKRLYALYVNPFLLACEELQSRLYNILAKEGLVALNTRSPDGSYAEETLYLVVQHFGWQRCVYRYYHDPKIIQLLEQIRDAFATDRYNVGAFCFHRPHQRSLGELIMLRTEGEYGFEFETKGYNEFLKLLAAPELQHMGAIQQTLTTLRSAKQFRDLPSDVSRRLVRIQRLLVELLNYIEEKENISFFYSEKQQRRSAADERICR